MRMVNPAWEAIKEFQHATRICDVQFDLNSGEIPDDHGFRLFEALAAHLPWLRDIADVGVHPVHGAPSGRNDNLVLNRRVKLVIRAPRERVAEMASLVGKTIDPGAGPLLIGAMKEKPLAPCATIYSHLVLLGESDEVAFLAEARRRLENMEIRCGLIPGKQRKIHSPTGPLVGYSLMLHDVTLAQSVALQESGLGGQRGYGCGIFIPHKSIKEVASD